MRKLAVLALLGSLIAIPLSAGTPYLVKDINQNLYPDGVTSMPSNPESLVPFRGGVFFMAASLPGSWGGELWFSDGTAAGTKFLLAGAAGQGDHVAYPCGSRALFNHYSTAYGREPWITDGTAAGTVLLKDITTSFLYSPGSPNSSVPGWVTCVDGTFLFTALTATFEQELWRSDGTSNGTQRVKWFGRPEEENILWVAPFDHRLFVATHHGTNDRVWRSDGTAAGTVVMIELPAGQQISRILASGPYLYIAASAGSTSTLWRSDGTLAGTSVLLTANGAITLLADVYGRLAYSTSSGFCSTDGTGPGTCYQPQSVTGTWPLSVMPMNGRLFYTKHDLRSTDGVSETHTGVTYAREIMATGGGLLYAVGNFDSTTTANLIESDGTPAGSRLLIPARTTGTSQAVNPNGVASSGGRVFFGTDELFALDSDVTPTGFSPTAVPTQGGQTITIAGRGFTAPVAIKVGGTDALLGTVTPTSITFTAPAHDFGFYPVDLSLGDGRRMMLDEPLSYTCSATAAATVDPTPVCPLTPVTLQGSGGTRCAWLPAEGLDDASSCTPKATVAATTTYTLIVYTDSGCPSTNNASVTVNIAALPDTTITIAGIEQGLKPNSTFTASVPDAGLGATYAWQATGVTITGGQNARTVTFSTSCVRDISLQVTVTNATGCSATTNQLFGIPPAVVHYVSPTRVTAGMGVTIKGLNLDCTPPLQLTGFDDSIQATVQRPITFSKINRETLLFRMPGNAVRKTQLETVTPGTAIIYANTIARNTRRDFGNDLYTDVFWRNAATGASSVWGMHGAAFYGLVSPAVPPTWTLAAIGNFDNDPYSDIFWYNPATGETSIWLMFGETPRTTVRSTRVPVGWKPVGAADFNGDGRDDLFWHNPATGETSIWFMNGITVTSAIRSLTIPVDWQPATFGDFNADAVGDVLWTRPSTGETSIWLMNGNGTPGTTVRSDTVPTPWKLGGSADFNGDRKADLFWYNPNTGATQIWHLNGAVIASKSSPLTMTPGFVPAVIGHFDDDSAADVLWYNPTTGDTSVWRRAFDVNYGAPVPLYRVPDTNWKPVILQ